MSFYFLPRAVGGHRTPYKEAVDSPDRASERRGNTSSPHPKTPYSVTAFLVRNSNAVSSLSLGTFYVLMSLADVTRSEGASVEAETGLGR